MADKSPRKNGAKVAGRTLKEKRADKKDKQSSGPRDSDVVAKTNKR